MKNEQGLNRSVGKSEGRISEWEGRAEKFTPNTSQGDKKMKHGKEGKQYGRHSEKD